MANILLITDYSRSKQEIEDVQTLLKEGKHHVVVTDLYQAGVKSEQSWDAIIVWVDSASSGQKIIRLIREVGEEHEDTPIVYWQPSTLVVKNVSIAYEPKSFPSMVHNVLAAKKEAEKKKVGPV